MGEGYLKRGNKSFLKLGECTRYMDFFKLDQGLVNYNIKISSLPPFRPSHGGLFILLQISFFSWEIVGPWPIVGE